MKNIIERVLKNGNGVDSEVCVTHFGMSLGFSL